MGANGSYSENGRKPVWPEHCRRGWECCQSWLEKQVRTHSASLLCLPHPEWWQFECASSMCGTPTFLPISEGHFRLRRKVTSPTKNLSGIKKTLHLSHCWIHRFWSFVCSSPHCCSPRLPLPFTGPVVLLELFFHLIWSLNAWEQE